MDLNLLNTFTLVYRLNSYTKAAEHLGISQAAVSMRIKQLEQGIGQPLFVRKGRSIEATAHANYMTTKLEPAFSLIDEALFKVQHKVYAPDLYAYDLAHVDVDVSNPPDEQQQLFDDIRNRQVDLVLDLVTINDASVVNELLVEEQVRVAVRRDHPRVGDTLTEAQFYGERHVAVTTRRHKHDIFTLLCEQPKPRTITHRASSYASQLAYVAHSDAIAVTPKRLESMAEQLGVKLLAFPMPMKSAPISMLYHRSLQSNPDHKALRARVRQALNPNDR
ncbi:LysR family transcriptional regulator [Ferrimonas sp.]|uniref:LysR family transcriptional regulator n=1 Tax=Ferrimonas sp. TaxID=2080861 RepID=UPI003A922DCE